jgi:small subunit ribosomal protein S8
MENSVIDLIIRIKNGYMAKNETVQSPYSRVKEEVLKKLVDLGFVKKIEVEGDQIKTITIKLSYPDGMPALTDVKIFSKPGSRQYVSYKDLKPVLGGLGYSILSTPKGIMTNKEARKMKIGGELLFSIW